MRNNQKDLTSKNFGLNNKQFKSSKKSKGTKKSVERELYCVTISSEILSEPKHEKHQQPPIGESDNMKINFKSPQMEKWKQDGTEWKALKKIDYQRLETVLEEGQLSCEETQSKHTHDGLEKNVIKSCSECASPTLGLKRTKKLVLNNSTPFIEHPKMIEGEESTQPETQMLYQYGAKQYQTCQKQRLNERQQSSEKMEKIVMGDPHGEPADLKSRELIEKLSETKRNIILNGMVEILPIFSNDKFVYSRDAISVAEYDDIETFDKNMSPSGKTLFESKSVKSADLKSCNSSIRAEKNWKDILINGPGSCKELRESTFCFGDITDGNVLQKTSSPFINSLMILISLTDQRKKMTEDSTTFLEENIPAKVEIVRQNIAAGEKFSVFKAVYAVIITVFGLLTMLIVTTGDPGNPHSSWLTS